MIYFPFRNDPVYEPVLQPHEQDDLEEHFQLLIKKGVYPYEYMDSFERFQETSLPAKEHFYSHLTETNITDEQYSHAQTVWESFEMETMQDYHNMYLVTDVLILADIFEEFRKICLENYELDSSHNFSAPGLAWQAALKMTNVNLQLLTDIEMHLFVEEGIRGGVSMICHRYAEANLPSLPNYNPNIPDTNLIYLDANNLYGWAMSQYLPTGDFQWLSEDEI